MKSRCYKHSDVGYKNYGARGITVCERWRDSFENFLADMGERPAHKFLDRIDVNGNYEPGNCRWVTSKEQARNRRNNVKLTHPSTGETLCLADWDARIGGLGVTASRLRAGWTVEEALVTPRRSRM